MRRISPRERITQRSIGFRARQIWFFDEYPEFKPDEFVREAVDEEIEKIDAKFLEEKF